DSPRPGLVDVLAAAGTPAERPSALLPPDEGEESPISQNNTERTTMPSATSPIVFLAFVVICGACVMCVRVAYVHDRYLRSFGWLTGWFGRSCRTRSYGHRPVRSGPRRVLAAQLTPSRVR